MIKMDFILCYSTGYYLIIAHLVNTKRVFIPFPLTCTAYTILNEDRLLDSKHIDNISQVPLNDANIRKCPCWFEGWLAAHQVLIIFLRAFFTIKW